MYTQDLCILMYINYTSRTKLKKKNPEKTKNKRKNPPFCKGCKQAIGLLVICDLRFATS